MKKSNIFLIFMLMCSILFSACDKTKILSEKESKENITTEIPEETPQINEQIEKGYNLPVKNSEKKEAERDCKQAMELIFEIYKNAEKGNTLNVVLSQEILYEMTEKIAETGNPAKTSETYSNLKNHNQFDKFLNSCIAGKSGSSVIYEIHSDGSIGREKYIYDGKDMYVVTANASWDNHKTSISYTRLKEWKYTKKDGSVMNCVYQNIPKFRKW